MKFAGISHCETAANFLIVIHRVLTMQLNFFNAGSVAPKARGLALTARGRFSAPLRFDRQSGLNIVGLG